LLDRYYPIEPLGSGGFAQIYTVWDVKTQTEKVLKVLVENSPKALELFIQEAEVLSNFRNPGVPKVDADGYFQINLTNPKPHQLACLVMEKIDGQNLEEFRKRYPQGCPEDLVLNWFSQAVKILQELHHRNIIHRDIKPSNLMLRTPAPNASSKLQQLVLIDFGGAKQFSGGILRSPSPSTRLFSSGYSPPEQIIGGNVGPAADFYALGRTMIELLTGKYPQELEDPITGKLNWRKWCNVNIQLADLLDEMIQADVRARPSDAGSIQKRLLAINSIKSKKLPKSQRSQKSQPGFFTQIKNTIIQSITEFTQAVGNTTLFTVQAIFKFLKACLATIWAIILSSIGASLGTIAGFFLAYHTKLGAFFAEFISRQLPQLIPNFQPSNPKEMIIYGIAGLGTAWGITLSGSFGQKRRFLVSALMGLIGYSSGWITWQFIKPQDSPEGLIAWMLISISLLTLGLGLRSHYLAYAFIAAFGSANIVAGLIHLGLKISFIHFSNEPRWLELFVPIAFFSFIGILISLCLGLSSYIIVPCLRWLGWR
jgi:serine/threonine protein kinase